MKKSRKHITFSALLAIFLLSAQTVFFPLHYYFTHHNTFLHAGAQHEGDTEATYKKANIPLSNTIEEEGCYWCDLFSHQGYFVEKLSEFTFFNTEIGKAQALAITYFLLEADLPVSRGPPASLTF